MTATQNKEDDRPVLVVTTKGGKLVHAGDPTTIGKKLIAQYAQSGYTMKTITIAQYRKKKWKWHWEK